MPRVTRTPTIKNYRDTKRVFNRIYAAQGGLVCGPDGEIETYLIDGINIKKYQNGNISLIGFAHAYVPDMIVYHPCGRIKVDANSHIKEQAATWINTFTPSEFGVSTHAVAMYRSGESARVWRMYSDVGRIGGADFYDGVIIEPDGSIRPSGEETPNVPENDTPAITFDDLAGNPRNNYPSSIVITGNGIPENSYIHRSPVERSYISPSWG